MKNPTFKMKAEYFFHHISVEGNREQILATLLRETYIDGMKAGYRAAVETPNDRVTQRIFNVLSTDEPVK